MKEPNIHGKTLIRKQVTSRGGGLEADTTIGFGEVDDGTLLLLLLAEENSLVPVLSYSSMVGIPSTL